MTNPFAKLEQEINTAQDRNCAINGYELVCTCIGCPEQYDVYLDNNRVGYLRLRHGYFYASTPDYDGVQVYESYPEGDGEFTDEERLHYLTNAVQAINQYVYK